MDYKRNKFQVYKAKEPILVGLFRFELITFFWLVLGIFLIFITIMPKNLSEAPLSKIFISPPKDVEKFTGGYSEIIADSYWIRLIQDIHTCDKERLIYERPSDSSFEQIVKNRSSTSTCPNSWVYRMSEAVVSLAPKFRYAYWATLTSLMITVEDYEGAERVLEKGLANIPKYWQLAYSGSYLYIFELKNMDRAADLLLYAHQNGGPAWFPVLASRLYLSSNRKSLAESVLKEYILTEPGGEAEARAREKLKQISESETNSDSKNAK